VHLSEINALFRCHDSGKTRYGQSKGDSPIFADTKIGTVPEIPPSNLRIALALLGPIRYTPTRFLQLILHDIIRYLEKYNDLKNVFISVASATIVQHLVFEKSEEQTMSKKRMFWLIVFGSILVGCFFANLKAAPPWMDLISLKQVEADPDKTYKLGEENGPWTIMACSFSGDGAEKQAQELVYELRKRYKLPAYTHKAQFDLNAAEGRGVDRYGAPVKMRYSKGSEIKEWAVLVGDYPAVDDPDAQRILKTIKVATPQCLEVKDGKKTNQTLAGWRTSLKNVLASENKELGPMGHAFITTNPLMPPEYFAPKGLDSLVIEMNKNVTHSLLDCPGKYTVQVATFKGQEVIEQSEITAIQSGKKELGSDLADAAMKAHQLTEALRMKGYEAYEFHDRKASIVTVGSFDSVGTPRPDGRIEINPKIHAIMKTFGSEPLNLPGQTVPVTPLKSLAGINFDIQPIPVLAPKNTLSAALSRPPVQ
jgi:hypothetical protein